MIASRVSAGWQDLLTTASDWDRILRSCDSGVKGPDITASSVWARALAQSFLRHSDVSSLVLHSESELVALLPLFRSVTPMAGLSQRELRTITEAHAGRTGLLVSKNDPVLTEALLESAKDHLDPWDSFTFGVVEGSASHAAVTRAASRLSLPLRCLAVNESPYIELGSGWEALLSALPKKMRWTIRKSEKDLRLKGHLDYEHMTDPASAGPLLQAIYTIERRSWKEEAGTSITSKDAQQTFYEALVPLAAEAGILSGHVLRLNGRPVAYILGLSAGDGAFLDLKESFDVTHAASSPGHVLKRFAIDTLITQGVTLYDFMGTCEPYKMRWTDRTYRRLTLTLYSGSIRSHIFHLKSRVRGRLSRLSTAAPRVRR